MAAIVINVAGSYDNKAISQAQRELEKLKSAGDDVATGVAASWQRTGQKLGAIGDSIGSFGKKWTTNVTLPIVGIGAAAVIAFDKVDSGMDTVAAKSGATGQELASLQESFKTVASTAVQGMDEVGNVVGTVAGRLGLTGTDLETFSTKVLDLARVTGTDATTAAESLVTTMNALGVSAADSAPLMDSLVTASQRSGLTLDELTSQLTTAAPAFATYGLGVQESIGLLSAFGQAGIPSTRVVSGLSTAFKNLQKEGIKDLPTGLELVFRQIQLAKTPAEATARAVEVFGSRVGVTMAQAIRSGKVSLEDLQAGLSGTEGALANATTAVEGPQEQMARLKNEAMLLGAQFAEVAIPIGQQLVPMLQSMMNWFKQLDPATKELIVKIAGFAAVIGPTAMILGKFTSGLGAVITFGGQLIGLFTKLGIGAKLASVGMWLLNAALGANPIFLIIGAIVALVAGLVLAYHKFDWFRNFVDGVWQGIQSVVAAVVDWFQATVWPTLQQVFQWIGGALSALWEAYKAYWGFIFGIVQRVAAWFMEYVWPTIQTVFGYIGTALGVLWEAYKTYWTLILNAVRAVADWFMATLWPGIQRVFGLIGAAVGALWDAYKRYWTFIWDLVKSVLSWITGTLWPGIQSAFNSIRDVVQGLWEKFQTAFNLIKSHVETVINTVKTILRGIGDVVSTVVGFFDNIRQGIVDKFTAALDFVRGIPGKIISALGSVASLLWSVGSDLIGGLIEGIKARASEVLSTIANFITDKIPQWVKDRLGIASPSKVMIEIGKWIPAGLAEGIRKNAKDVEAAMRDLGKKAAEKASDAAKSALDSLKDKAREVVDYIRDVRDSIKDFGGVMRTEFDRGTLTSSTIIQQMRDRLAAAQQFAATIAQLQRLGLNSGSLQQIIQAGPDSGLEIARALAEGGASAIADVNMLERALGAAGSYIGDVGAQDQYGMSGARAAGYMNSGVRVEAGAIVLNFGDGLTGQDRATIQQTVEAAIQSALRDLAREIQTS
jgi:phage-related minor tail protein